MPPERLECGLVVRSIGQRSVQIDPDLPFDEERGVIACSDEMGRVPLPARLQGVEDGGAQLYASGWAKVGAVGVILNTLADARVTAEVILSDLAAEKPSPDHVGFIALRNIIESRGMLNLSSMMFLNQSHFKLTSPFFSNFWGINFESV